MNLRRKAKRAALCLHKIYGSPRHGNKTNPLDELVFIVLSQMTTHHSYSRVYDRLKRKYASWDAVLELPLGRLKAIIKDAGLSRQKAPHIKSILGRLRRDFGEVSLNALNALPDDEAEAYLVSLPGVGTKTAKCVLMYSLGREVLPVDTHVWRLARRLGLLSENVTYRKVHEVLEAVVAPADRYIFHVNAISHGRAACLPVRPRCGECALRHMCLHRAGRA